MISCIKIDDFCIYNDDCNTNIKEGAPPAGTVVSFLWKNPDFLMKNPDFLLKNVDFITKQEAAMPKIVHQRPNEAMMPTTPLGTAAFYVTCPVGVAAGSAVAISAFGTMCMITIPPDIVPGQQFIATLPTPVEGVPPEPELVADTWYYVDPSGTQHGPHTAAEMKGWAPYFPPTCLVLPPVSTKL